MAMAEGSEIDPEWLRRRHIDEGVSASDIAREIGGGMTKHRVIAVLRKHGITRCPNGNTIRSAQPKTVEFYKDPKWLRARYWDDGMTFQEIADLVGAHMNSIRNQFTRHKIPRRDRNDRPLRGEAALLDDPAWLRARYVDDRMSAVGIGSLVGMSDVTVGHRLQQFGIRRPIDDRDWLERAHIVEGRSITAIAREIGSTPSTVRRALQSHGICRKGELS